MTVHILPLNDTETHTASTGCECLPQPDRNGYWIHNSYDGRESEPTNGTHPLNWTFEISDDNE